MNDNVRKVFDMLGVEPGELFKVKDCDNCIHWRFYFNEELICYQIINNKEHIADNMLANILNGYYTIIKIGIKVVLDDKEKTYLSNIIKPFRNKVSYIQKIGNSKQSFIFIRLNNGESTTLPLFDSNKMYINMVSNKNILLKN